MTTTEVVRLIVPQPLVTRRPLLDAPERYKVWRKGRRAGGTRTALHAALWGHGRGSGKERQWAGLAQGRDVAWLAPDYPQGTTVWQEDIVPLFANQDGWLLSSKSPPSLTLEGHGTLYFYSAENVNAIRGRGKNLGGIVVDEAAHQNLRDAWRQVLRPALTDCHGWAIFPSTTNAGPDGGLDESGHRRSPSFFNTLCEQIIGGVRSKDWGQWHFDARTNPAISPAEFAALVGEYTPGEPALREEVYAELLVGGAGLCFPEWDRDIHVHPLEPHPDASCSAGMDWGHGTPGWFGIVYTQPSGMLLRHELYFDHTRAKKVGYRVGKMCLAAQKQPEIIALDVATFAETGNNASIAGKIDEGIALAYQRFEETTGEKRYPPPLVKAPKGPDAVRHQTALLREVLGWEKDADGVLVEPPILTVHPDCRDFTRTVAVLPLDPHDPNKFDTRAEDHPIQGLAYLLGITVPEYRKPAVSREVRAQRAQLDQASRREAEKFDQMAAKLERKLGRRR